MTTLPDDTAFPVKEVQSERTGEWYVPDQCGLSKREHFAAMAMQGLLACPTTSDIGDGLGVAAVSYADALIAALNKEPAP